MIDFSLLCCSSGVSLTYSSTSSFGGEAIHRDIKHRYQRMEKNRAARSLPCRGVSGRSCSPGPRAPKHPGITQAGKAEGPAPGPRSLFPAQELRGPPESRRSLAWSPLPGRPGQAPHGTKPAAPAVRGPAASPGRPAAPRGRSRRGARPAGSAAPRRPRRPPPRRTAAAAPARRARRPAASRRPHGGRTGAGGRAGGAARAQRERGARSERLPAEARASAAADRTAEGRGAAGAVALGPALRCAAAPAGRHAPSWPRPRPSRQLVPARNAPSTRTVRPPTRRKARDLGENNTVPGKIFCLEEQANSIHFPVFNVSILDVFYQSRTNKPKYWSRMICV